MGVVILARYEKKYLYATTRDHGSSVTLVAGDERTIIAIVALHRSETSLPADILHFPKLGPWCRSSTITLVW